MTETQDSETLHASPHCNRKPRNSTKEQNQDQNYPHTSVAALRIRSKNALSRRPVDMAAIDPATATSRRSKARPLWARTPRSRSHPSPGLIVFPTLDKLSTRWEFAHIVDNITTLQTFKDALVSFARAGMKCHQMPAENDLALVGGC